MIEVLYIARAWGYDESMLPSAAIDHSINVRILKLHASSSSHTLRGI
jgi:hypothetical protein